MINHKFYLPFGEVGRGSGRVGISERLENGVGGVTFRLPFRFNVEHVPQSPDPLQWRRRFRSQVGSFAKPKTASYQTLPHPAAAASDLPKVKVKERGQESL